MYYTLFSRARSDDRISVACFSWCGLYAVSSYHLHGLIGAAGSEAVLEMLSTQRPLGAFATIASVIGCSLGDAVFNELQSASTYLACSAREQKRALDRAHPLTVLRNNLGDASCWSCPGYVRGHAALGKCGHAACGKWSAYP